MSTVADFAMVRKLNGWQEVLLHRVKCVGRTLKGKRQQRITFTLFCSGVRNILQQFL